jgi:hypothetical protein
MKISISTYRKALGLGEKIQKILTLSVIGWAFMGTVALCNSHLYKENETFRAKGTKFKFVNGKLFQSSSDMVRQGVDKVDENWFNQKLDHFNITDERKWEQVLTMEIICYCIVILTNWLFLYSSCTYCPLYGMCCTQCVDVTPIYGVSSCFDS